MKLPFLVCIFVSMISSTFAGTIEEDFANPPVNTRPYVWWHWMGRDVSKEGITKDLEAMREAGIGGATIFNLTSCSAINGGKPSTGLDPAKFSPWPDVKYRSAKWWELVEFAASEAKRLGLEIGMHNCVGYSATGGPWITPEKSMQKVVWTETAVTGPAEFKAALAQPQAAKNYYQDIAVIAVPEGAAIASSAVLDLTKKMNVKGELAWSAPAGAWQVYRFGHTTTGAGPHPVPEDVSALEADKMDRAASRFHFEHVVGPLKEHLGEYIGTTFKHLTLDSYEAGSESWSASFREEFQKRKGYDPVPWLVTFSPSVTGDRKSGAQRIVGDAEQTARFEWDYKDVIAQLFQECNFAQGAQIMHEAKLEMQFEPYSGPFSTISGAAVADIPMGEFWSNSGGGINGGIVPSARAAGHRVVGAEALTGWPQLSKWVEDPAMLKGAADGAFSVGVNRLVLHHWVEQPFGDAFKPGMTMGWWGTHFGRNQTWFEPGKAFYAYLGRCESLLQRGEGVADYLALEATPEGADTVDTATFLRDVTVESGRLALPSGRRYAMLMVPGGKIMLPEVARKVKELLAAGAKVGSPKPEHSPSLKDWPNADAELKQLADEVWGNGEATPREGRAFGKGLVNSDAGALSKQAVPVKDFEFGAGSVQGVHWTHRSDAGTEIYYLTNTAADSRAFTGKFRVAGKQPEYWQPEDGSRTRAGGWRQADAGTEIDLNLAPQQTVFVVFQHAAEKVDPVIGVTADGKPDKDAQVIAGNDGVARLEKVAPGRYALRRASGSVQTVTVPPLPEPVRIAGSWELNFAPGQDAPASMALPELGSWSVQENTAVKYFSGTVIYRKDVQVPDGFLNPDRRVFLDLGKVMNLAAVTVNGKKIGVAWHPPFRLDATAALKPGVNKLEIAVTNTWHNRLIGDEQEPLDVRWGTDQTFAKQNVGAPLAEYPDWFLAGQPRPSKGRKCFVTWNYFHKDEPLLEAGLLGPVTLQSESNQPVNNSRP